VAQGDREWGSWSVHHTLSLPLLPPQGEDSSHSSPAPTRGPSHGRQFLQRQSFPLASALYELPQCGSFPQGAVLQEQAAPVWVTHGVTSPASKPALAWAPLSTSPQVLAGACSCAGLPMGSQLPSGIHLLWCGVPSMGYRLISAPPWTSMDCRGTVCLTRVSITSCKGRLSPPVSRAPPPLSFFTDLGVCRVVSFTSSHSSLSTAVSPHFFFFPFLNLLSQRCYHHQ